MMIPGLYNAEEARLQAVINIGTLQFIKGPEILPDKNKWCFYQTNLGMAYAIGRQEEQVWCSDSHDLFVKYSWVSLRSAQATYLK